MVIVLSLVGMCNSLVQACYVITVQTVQTILSTRSQ